MSQKQMQFRAPPLPRFSAPYKVVMPIADTRITDTLSTRRMVKSRQQMLTLAVAQRLWRSVSTIKILIRPLDASTKWLIGARSKGPKIKMSQTVTSRTNMLRNQNVLNTDGQKRVLKNYHPIPWRDSILRPPSSAGRPRRQGPKTSLSLFWGVGDILPECYFADDKRVNQNQLFRSWQL
jgi:hypothetical protein